MKEKLESIKLLILDVDGVMTDGRIIWDANGVESKFFNVKDGHGIKLVQRAGIQVGIISGRNSQVVDLRAKELGIELVYQGSLQKLESYADMLKRTALADHQVAYMGDDVIDIPVMRKVAFAAAPADALEIVKSNADFISCHNGGMGAVRELCDLLLQGCGAWEELVLKRYC